MEQWLDTLSEDWPSQPPSRRSSLNINNGSASLRSSVSQTRIPRAANSRSSLGKSSSVRGYSSLRRSSSIQHVAVFERPDGPLKERSSSSLNAAGKRVPEDAEAGKTTPEGRDPDETLDLGLENSSSFEVENHEEAAGTVQIKASPTRQKELHDTPEWKRRVVQGKGGAMNQTDLFAPMGLENVFRPPTAASKSRGEGGRKSRMPLHLRNVSGTERRAEEPELQAESRLKEMTPVDGGSHREPAEDKDDSPISSGKSVSRHESDSQNRTGFTQMQHEQISPFYVSKHHTIDGKVDYAAIDMSLRALNSNMEKLRQSSRASKSFSSAEAGTDETRMDTPGAPKFHDGFDEITSQSLPGDLSVGTDAFVAGGGYVNLQRGGHSAEGSFQRRSLSLSSSLLQSPEEGFPAKPSSRRSSQHTPHPRTPPKTPQRNGRGQSASPDRPKTSGSPLKLFDKYDTFTNNRLARQISKFEETLGHGEDPEEQDESELPTSPSPGPKRERGKSDSGRRVSSFGTDDLEEHQFLPEHGNSAQALRKLSSEFKSGYSQREKQTGPRTQSNFGNIRDQYGDDQMPVTDTDATEANYSMGLSHIAYSTYGKRLPTSPAKDPSTKRRKTISDSEEQVERIPNREVSPPPFTSKENPSHSLQGRKRKDARYNQEVQEADPQLLAMRQIRRPRSLTPKEQPLSSNQSQAESRSTSHLIFGNPSLPDESLDPNVDLKMTVDPPTQIVAGALASIAIHAVQDVTDGSRKPSVTTSDFFKEAQQIMAFIRADTRPRSSHATTEASEVAHLDSADQTHGFGSTRDDITRPPSREGHRMQKAPPRRTTDARMVSHLRKFEDQDSLGLALPSSMDDLKFAADEFPVPPSAQTPENGGLDDVECDPPNVRIRDRGSAHRQDGVEGASEDDGERFVGPEDQAGGSYGSSRPSTSSEVKTGSSRSSVTIKKIAPESVAHLLSDQIADMVFDHDKKAWVKRRSSDTKIQNATERNNTSGSSLEDLFNDIPDLTVDEMNELKRVKDAVILDSRTSSTAGIVRRDYADFPPTNDHVKEHSEPAPQDERPKTADGKVIPPAEDSSAPSKFSNFAWSGPRPGTRATSYGDDVWPQKHAQSPQAAQPVEEDEEVGSDWSEEVEHEFSMLEGRHANSPAQRETRQYQPRVVTVTFSSPLVHSPPDPDATLETSHGSPEEESPSRSSRRASATARNEHVKTSKQPNGRSRTYGTSFSRSNRLTRPMSRLDEHEELSLVNYPVETGQPPPDNQIVLSTPLPLSKSLIVTPAPAQRSSAGFELSPLPDFTFHQVDRPLDPIEPADDVHLRRSGFADASNGLSLTAQELVKRLTDLEPYEPYWHHLRYVDLGGCGLSSLHMLRDFCARAEELDVSGNQIRELEGIPTSVRVLDIRGNSLSDLTAWHTLLHLQYLDVSGNQLQSLEALQSLVHLRSLRADDNKIESLDGIRDLDALLNLSVAGNLVRDVDFEDFRWKRLSELDLRNNDLSVVNGLHSLLELRVCRLGQNHLDVMKFCKKVPNLSHLDLSGNNLWDLNVDKLSSLRHLNIDGNMIISISGTKSCENLESLSWREQRPDDASKLDIRSLEDIRMLYLAGTKLNQFAPVTPFLNLEVLELASTGLQSLPLDFGAQCQNLRWLNLNFNAIRDLRPLLSIEKLRHLYVAGNRLSRLRRTAATLKKLAGHLVEIDLRNNPLNIGFYTPDTIGLAVSTSNPARSSSSSSSDGRGEECSDRDQVIVHPLRSAPSSTLTRKKNRESNHDSIPNHSTKSTTISTKYRRLSSYSSLLSQPNSQEKQPHQQGDDVKPTPYLLPPLAPTQDLTSRSRLDEDTALRRRVYEMLLTHSCPALVTLDSLPVDRRGVGRRDETWRRLVRLGVLRKDGGAEVEGGEGEEVQW